MDISANHIVMNRQEALDMIVLLTQAVQKEIVVGYGNFNRAITETVYVNMSRHVKASSLCVTVQEEIKD